MKCSGPIPTPWRRATDRLALCATATLALATSPTAAVPANRAPGEARDELKACTGAKESSTPPEEPGSQCPVDMVEVDGDWCPVVEQWCLRPVDPKHVDQDRCAEFAATTRCLGTSERKRFCIDRYEWPNEAGVKPVVAVDWDAARAQCTSRGKRLCVDQEWTLACEGREHLPYPYGFARNADACNIDKPYIFPDDAKWANPSLRPSEIARLDQRDPSGARESCVSPYGVFDMTGNVDEWVYNEQGRENEKPYFSGLKGGYWGPVRDRCRPMTTDHGRSHTGYQIGFRCCASLPDTGSTEPRQTASGGAGDVPSSLRPRAGGVAEVSSAKPSS
jgi:sulfatase modifying factor 1